MNLQVQRKRIRIHFFLKKIRVKTLYNDQNLTTTVSSRWILDATLVQDPPEILGIRRVVTLVGVGRLLMPDGAEQYHTGDLAKQLEESYD